MPTTTTIHPGRVWDQTPDRSDTATEPIPLIESRATRGWWVAAAVIALLVGMLTLAPPDAASVGSTAEAEHSVTADRAAPGSMYHVVDQVGARDLWMQGITGAGVNVAVIDTGVANVDALSGEGKIVAVADLSAEASDPSTRFVDSHGHGTAMAGIIGGNESGANPLTAAEHPDKFLGVAPDAGIVSVKVSGRDGASNPADVVAGVDWVIAHADELQIKVLNLSYVSGATGSYQGDPLTAALERAWDAGITVVTIAGNDGPDTEQLASPGIDPYVITVAAAEATDDGMQIAEFSSAGDGVRNPDVAASGAHIESLRAPGSNADLNHSDVGSVEGDPMLFKGSGTSEAAAVTSGVLALLHQLHPDMTPDQAKALLIDGAQPIEGSDGDAGADLISAEASASMELTNAQQTFERAIILPTSDVTGVPACTSSDCWGGAHWGGAHWGGAH
ncbi:S8 family serine peptidase, partial [Ilumatobacter nonamiensis]|uniref:S8 family serine peptidase n=1 Tax=Ilumatobacter nonamiensis TaxID=467093 RepID=UPI00130E52B7